jgi:phospholipase C
VSVRHRARRALAGSAALAAIAAVTLTPSAASAAPDKQSALRGINHIVVIYEENHSFDNLLGGWEGVNGLANAGNHATQVDYTGRPLPCLPQNDPTLKAVTGPDKCGGTVKLSDGTTATSPFANKPFRIDDYITPATLSCDNGKAAGGCTRDLVHRFYQEQYQIDGGKQDRYTVGSDALGLTQAYYDTRNLELYKYLHGAGAPNYAIADNFFQAAYGGSFLNHQWLIAADTPKYTGAVPQPDKLHAVLDKDGMPTRYPLQPANPNLVDGPLTQAANPDGSCLIKPGADTPPKGTVCGDWAVNTVQPASAPRGGGLVLQPLTGNNIGDLLSTKGVDWSWYAGGWDNATGNTAGKGYTAGPGPACGTGTVANPAYPKCPDTLFQYHHQPFNYFAKYGEGAPGRTHLQDEKDFLDSVAKGTLKPVSFIKPVGAENQHPGYASNDAGDKHLVDTLKKIAAGPNAKDTMVVVTYDEFGGEWDHVSPPKGDKWGPGTRIPALVLSPTLPHQFAVDHTQYDTTSILATIEHRYGLDSIREGSRDGKVKDLSHVFAAPAGPSGGTGGGSGGPAGGPTGGSAAGQGGGSGALPITGTDVAAVVIAGLALLVVGGAAMAVARRRRAA